MIRCLYALLLVTIGLHRSSLCVEQQFSYTKSYEHFEAKMLSLIATNSFQTCHLRFVRFAFGFLPWNDPNNLPSYGSRCKFIDLDLLKSRRNIAKATFVANLLTSSINCSGLLRQLPLNVQQNPLRSCVPLLIPTPGTNYGSKSPLKCMWRTYHIFDYNVSRSCIVRS